MAIKRYRRQRWHCVVHFKVDAGPLHMYDIVFQTVLDEQSEKIGRKKYKQEQSSKNTLSSFANALHSSLLLFCCFSFIENFQAPYLCEISRKRYTLSLIHISYWKKEKFKKKVPLYHPP